MKQAITSQLAAFVKSLSFDALPRQVIDVAKLGFLDTIGVMQAGRDEPAVRSLLSILSFNKGDCSLLLGTGRASAADAAWVNGTAAHALDYDDTALRGHTSAVLVPAILAVGETVGATGKQLVAAYVAGYEVWAELVRRDKGQHHAKGWHPTGIFGSIAAAASCAYLLGCDATQIAAALGLGASQSAGLMANFGSMAKPFHAGRAAHAGVISAQLAKAGMTASADALEHPQGFLAAVSPAGNVDVDSPVDAGKVWRLAEIGLSIKKYPTCYCTHRAIDGLLDLVMKDQLHSTGVESISVTMSRRNATVLRNHRPQTGLEAKFSIEYVMAAGIVAGRVGLNELTDEFVRRQDVQHLIEKVKVNFSELPEDTLTGYAPFDEVVVHTKEGKVLASGAISVVSGSPNNPLSDTEIRAKFEDCMGNGPNPVSKDSTVALYEALIQLESAAATSFSAICRRN